MSVLMIWRVTPRKGIRRAQQFRNNPKREIDIGSGPGKLCKAMSIDKTLNGEDLLGATIWIEDRKLDPGAIRTSPRVGVDYAGEYKDKPWRFYIEGNPHVSRVRFSNVEVP